MSCLPAIPQALGQPFLFPSPKGAASVLRQIAAMPKLAGVTAASRLEVRSAPEMASSGIAEIDMLAGGLPRGCLTEICGIASSGRTTVMLASLAAATHRGEVCALVDITDSLHPHSAESAGVDLKQLLWIRCGEKPCRKQRHTGETTHCASTLLDDLDEKKSWKKFQARLDQALRVIDLLLQSGGFGQVAIDLGDVPFQAARRVPLTTWFRFRRAVEHTPTVLLAIAEAACAQTCATLVMNVKASPKKLSAVAQEKAVLPSHSRLFGGIGIEAELLRSRLERKPMQSVKTVFATRAG